MKKRVFLSLMIALAVVVAAQQVSKIVEVDGTYFTDRSQEKVYTGEYREYYEDGKSLRLELNIVDGKPEGRYVIYHKNGRPSEVRSYKKGHFHGIWRTYNEAGLLIAEAEYLNGKKSGRWSVWDDNGILRYEMYYQNGAKTGTWYMWDEKGKLISEKKY